MVAPGIDKDMTVPMCLACCFTVASCLCGTSEHHINTEPRKKRGKKRGKKPSKKPSKKPLDKTVDFKEATRLATHLNWISDLESTRRRHVFYLLRDLTKLPVSATMTPNERQDFICFLETTKCGLRLDCLRKFFPDKVIKKQARFLRNKWKSALCAK